MIFSSIGNILNESQMSIEEVVATNEGYTFEGGFERALILAEEENHAIKMAHVNCETFALYKAISESTDGVLSESSIEEAYVLQEKVLGSLFENLRQMLKKLAGRVKEIINSLKMHFDKTFNKSNYLTNAKDKLKQVSNFGGAKIEGFSYTQDAVDPVAIYNKMANKAKSEHEKILGMVKDANKVEDARKQNEGAIKAYEEFKSEEFLNKMAKEAGAEDRQAYSKHLYQELRNGKDVKEEMDITSTSEAFKMLDGFKTTQATLNGLAAKVDTLYSAAKKTIDEAEKKHTKVHQNSQDGARVAAELRLKVIQAWADRTSKANVMANEAIKAKLAALREEKSQNMALISKAMSGAKKSQKDAKLGESTVIDSFMPAFLK